MHFAERVSNIRRRDANISTTDGPFAHNIIDRNENQMPNEISQILVSFQSVALVKVSIKLCHTDKDKGPFKYYEGTMVRGWGDVWENYR